jgi:hypothetical protein
VTNLTIIVNEETVKQTRMQALEEGTSVNALLRDYLEYCAGVRRELREAGRRLLELARNAGAGSGGEGLPKREE